MLLAGKLCVEVVPTSKIAWISEELCIGCGICVKVSAGLDVSVRCACPMPARSTGGGWALDADGSRAFQDSHTAGTVPLATCRMCFHSLGCILVCLALP